MVPYLGAVPDYASYKVLCRGGVALWGRLRPVVGERGVKLEQALVGGGVEPEQVLVDQVVGCR